jgi:peptidoglycan/LPS O-acetylase OafA/YrhL
MWSLSVEEQFYASIGIVCLLLDLFSRKRPKVTLAALGIGSLLLGVSIAMVRISISSQPPPYVPPKGLLPYLAEFRFDFLCAGVFLYWAYDTFNLRFAPRAWLSVVLFIAAVGPFVWFGKIGHPHEVYVIKKFARTGYPLAMLSFSTAVLLAASDISWIPRDSIVYRTLLYLGERSYLIYLFHIPLTAVAWMIMAWGFPNTIVSGAAAYAMVLFLFTAMLTLPLVEVLHRYVETPFIHVGARLSKRVFKVRSSEPIAGDAADPIKKSTDRPPETVESVQWNRAPSTGACPPVIDKLLPHYGVSQRAGQTFPEG